MRKFDFFNFSKVLILLFSINKREKSYLKSVENSSSVAIFFFFESISVEYLVTYRLNRLLANETYVIRIANPINWLEGCGYRARKLHRWILENFCVENWFSNNSTAEFLATVKFYASHYVVTGKYLLESRRRWRPTLPPEGGCSQF